jgi:hypothetical protein
MTNRIPLSLPKNYQRRRKSNGRRQALFEIYTLLLLQLQAPCMNDRFTFFSF